MSNYKCPHNCVQINEEYLGELQDEEFEPKIASYIEYQCVDCDAKYKESKNMKILRRRLK